MTFSFLDKPNIISEVWRWINNIHLQYALCKEWDGIKVASSGKTDVGSYLLGQQTRVMFLVLFVPTTHTTFFTNIAEAYDDIGIPAPAEEETLIQADTWQQAMLIRLEEPPAYQFKAKVWMVRQEAIEWEMAIEYTVTMEFGNLYIDRLEIWTEDYWVLEMFGSMDELKEWLAS